MKNLFKSLLFVVIAASVSNAYAQSPVPSPSGLAAVAQQIQAQQSIDLPQLVADVGAIILGVKGSIPVGLKIAGVVLLLLALLKVSFLDVLWDKLGPYKALAAPVLGLVLGILLFPQHGVAAVLAYVSSGAGAIALHEILDALKALPIIGPTYGWIIDLFTAILGGQQASK